MDVFIQVFGLFSLSPREGKWSGSGSILLLVLMLFISTSLGLDKFSAGEQTLRVVAQGFIMGAVLGVLSLTAMRGDARAEAGTDPGRGDVQNIIEHDALTGLYNRRHMQILLEAEMERRRRSGHSFCIALVDLDHQPSTKPTAPPGRRGAANLRATSA